MLTQGRAARLAVAMGLATAAGGCAPQQVVTLPPPTIQTNTFDSSPAARARLIAKGVAVEVHPAATWFPDVAALQRALDATAGNNTTVVLARIVNTDRTELRLRGLQIPGGGAVTWEAKKIGSVYRTGFRAQGASQITFAYDLDIESHSYAHNAVRAEWRYGSLRPWITCAATGCCSTRASID